MIPSHTKAALDRYVNQKYLPGGFLMAVLSNDLFGAVGRADSENLAALPDIVKYVYNQMPANSWGSQELVYKFVEDAFYNRVKETV
jgi:hypothetical protein